MKTIPRWPTRVAPLAIVTLRGAVAEQGKLQTLKGHPFCRIALQVGGWDMPVMAHGPFADELAALFGGDVIAITGHLLKNVWTVDGKPRDAMCVEANTLEVLWKRDGSLRPMTLSSK